jgi:hypothetical protein
MTGGTHPCCGTGGANRGAAVAARASLTNRAVTSAPPAHTPASTIIAGW